MKKANKARLVANRKARVAKGGPRRKPIARSNGSGRVALGPGGAGALSASFVTHIQPPDALARGHKKLGAMNNYVAQVFNGPLLATTGKQNQASYAHFSCAGLRQLINQLGAQRPNRILVDSLQEEYTMTNFTNVPIEVDIYDLVCKRDMYLNQGFTANNATDYVSQAYPEQYWDSGLNAQASVSNTSLLSRIPGTSPTDSQLFNLYFRIKKRTTLLMPIGGSHRHLVNIKCNRVVDKFLMGTLEAPTLINLANVTSFVMFNIKGLPCYGNPVVPGPAVTTSIAELGIVGVQRAKWTYIVDNTYASNVTATLPTTATADTFAVNAGSGAQNVVSGLVSI